MTTALIVDDDEDILEQLTEAMHEQLPEWTLLRAHTVDAAFNALDTESIDVVLADVDIDDDREAGLKILSRAKAKDRLMMVILMTAYDERLDRYNAFDIGAFECIQKLGTGIQFSEEAIFKARSAAHVRDLVLEEVSHRNTLDAMGRYMDPGVLKLLRETPDVLALRLRVVTVCFWDIRGFSKLCEALKAHPQTIAALLADYFERATDVISSRGGVLDKFIGDGIMALFGALPGSGADGDACQAADAAVELRRSFEELCRRWRSTIAKNTPQEVIIGLGAGLHTGEVLVGNVGTKLRDQFTALGPDVNFAQRLEAMAGASEIVVSASTAERIRSTFSFTDAGVIQDPKNIRGAFRIFKLDHRL